MAVGFGALAWAIHVPHTPALTPQNAAREISSTPEFNRRYSGVVVTSTLRAPKSMKDSQYYAELAFKENGSTSVLHGHAIFQWDNAWRLLALWYGEGPDRVQIK
jgi:hypothetical protein